MVVQAFNAHPTLLTVLHLLSAVTPTHHTVLLSMLLILLFLDGGEIPDSWVQKLREKIGDICKDEDSNVDD